VVNHRGRKGGFAKKGKKIAAFKGRGGEKNRGAGGASIIGRCTPVFRRQGGDGKRRKQHHSGKKKGGEGIQVPLEKRDAG